MKLIIGLGNPGKKYQKTWHNVGFLVLDELIKGEKVKFKKNSKFLAEISEMKILEEKTVLAKPLTYMNNSGKSVVAILKYFNLQKEDLIVIHDDIDLDLGKIRIVKNSSAGGHNGIKSLIELLDSKDFIRIKVGVKTEQIKFMDSADYVLNQINKQNFIILQKEISKAVLAVEAIISKSLPEAMNLYN